MNSVDFSSARWRKSSHSGGEAGDCVELAIAWRKSSRSGGEGGQCVELAIWRKSSHSGGDSGDCVELADLTAVIGVRDSKNPDGPVLMLTRAELAGLLTALRR